MENTKQVKLYNPKIVKLKTLNVEDKTVVNYFEQIKSNFYCSIKAHYLIARDLFDAKENLGNIDYARLVTQLGFSGASQSKYLSIGKDTRLMQLFTLGKLPMKWTSQYLLTQLTDAQFEKVAKVLDAETSAKDIKKIADFSVKQKQQIANDLLSFIQLQIDKTRISANSYERLVDKVKSTLNKIPEITIVDDKVDDVKEKIVNFMSKTNTAMAKMKTAKNILKNASAVATA